MSTTAHFAQSYVEARAKFLNSARAARLAVQSHDHPLRGRDGEVLALDVASLGDADATKLLVLSSGVHGVEGFAGSGVQNALLADADWLGQARRSGIAVLMLHAVNPWGFSRGERWTHENVDLNRNFVDFSDPAKLPRNPAYDDLAEALVPGRWPSKEADDVLYAFLARHGERALQEAISGGQYRHPRGLFYGGSAPTWSRLALEQVLRDHGTRCRQMAWIDLHTATGPAGGFEHLLPWADDPEATARARAWWGDAVKSLGDEDASLSALQGVVQLAARQLCAQAELTCTVLEFGTVTPDVTLMALRGHQWLKRHPETDAATRTAIERGMRDAFYTDTEAWKTGVVAQGSNAARRALSGLAAG